jgi:multimeric flavodoxin WrbA
MKVVVLNGSPKGDKSVTMQYVKFLQKKRPDVDFEIVPVARRMKAIERRDEEFQGIIEKVRVADAVLWAFPLYVCLVHSGYKRFIELVFERGAHGAFEGKYAASLSTSIHFFDHTAHSYIHAVCDDLGMAYVGAYPAEMRDLFEEEERERLLGFADQLRDTVERGIPTARRFPPLQHTGFEYAPSDPQSAVDTGSKKVLILTDADAADGNLARMVERLAASFAGGVQVANLHAIGMSGPCLGCCKCGPDYECAYTGKDSFIDFYNTNVKTADIIVFAGAMRDRHLSSTWRMFLERGFFNTHTPTLMGKQFGLVISGPAGQMPDMRQALEGYVEWQHANLVDVVTDEDGDSSRIDALLDALAARLVQCAEAGYVRPLSFLGVGGMKIFRDEIWGHLRFVFQADHQAFKRLGVYDFPQRDWKTRLLNAVVLPLTRIPAVRKRFRNDIRDGIFAPQARVVEEA